MTTRDVDLTSLSTVPELIRWRAETSPHKPAWFTKHDGQWQGVTWAQYQKKIEERAKGFYALGIRKGQRVALMYPNGLEWEVYEKSILMLGAIVVGLDAHASPQQRGYILQNSGAAMLIVENLECLRDMELAALPALKSVLSSVPLAMGGPPLDADKKIVLLETCTEMAASVAALPEGAAQENIATIIYTSGTTGQPKGIAYTHRQCLLACRSIMRSFPSFNAADVTMCILPLSHLFQRIINLCSVVVGGSVYFIDDPRQFQTDIHTINPTVMVGVPRLYEKLQEAVEQKLRSFPFGIGKFIPAALLRRCVLGNRMRLLMTGAAPISPQTLAFYQKLGIPLHEAYGLSENIIPIAMNILDSARAGSVGKPLLENRLQITAEGEILVKGEGVFSGYWQEQANDALFTPEGFYKTGDLGYLDADGFLYLNGRKSELIKTSTGRRISPRGIEEKLLTIPGTDIAVLFGNAHKNLTALIRCHSPVDAGYKRIVENHIREINSTLAHYERIYGVLLTNDAFNVARGHLTPSLKVRRKFIETSYANPIHALYDTLETSETFDIVIAPVTVNSGT